MEYMFFRLYSEIVICDVQQMESEVKGLSKLGQTFKKS
jgi:hypothetical protein